MKAVSIAAITVVTVSTQVVAHDERSPPALDPVLAVTMVLVPSDAELPGVVTERIELHIPREGGARVPSEAAAGRLERGIDTPNSARDAGRAFGEAAVAEARDNRESARASRSTNVDDLPEPPVGPPARIDRPTR
jgi:hypothetical protein